MHTNKIGLFEVGLDAYCPRFVGPKKRLEGYPREIERNLLSSLRYFLAIAALYFCLFLGARAADPGGQSVPVDDAPPVPRKSAVKVTPESKKRLAWWREARFGLFIHWGVYAVPGRDAWVMWSDQICPEEYEQFAAEFKPAHFDADAWAQTAKDAGMKYVVLTAKHHDGFALFTTKGDGFSSVETAAHRDFIKEYTAAVRKAGLGVGIYYSPLDWRYPGYFFPDLYRKSAEAMREKYHQQVTELMSNYGKIDILWYDAGGENWLAFGGLEKNREGWHSRPLSKAYSGKFSWQDAIINAKARMLQPEILINDRTRSDADFQTREGENKIGDFQNDTPWELCATLAGYWGYKPGKAPSSLDHCIRLLVNTVGRDGNLLLNVGPDADGRIEPSHVQRLKEIGDWLARYGESIYGTRGGPYLPQGKSLVSTRKGSVIYVHVLDWPEGLLTLPTLGRRILKATVLGGGEVRMKEVGGNIECNVPAQERLPMDTILKLELDGDAMELPLIDTRVRNTSKAVKEVFEK